MAVPVYEPGIHITLVYGSGSLNIEIDSSLNSV